VIVIAVDSPIDTVSIVYAVKKRASKSGAHKIGKKKEEIQVDKSASAR
jgi:hypothetical protein